VCRGCGAVADVDCVVGSAPCLHPEIPSSDAASGFTVDTAEIVFWGECPACRAERNA
jgi:Fur family transcriptional regulator, stress-responsive regulator